MPNSKAWEVEHVFFREHSQGRPLRCTSHSATPRATQRVASFAHFLFLTHSNHTIGNQVMTKIPTETDASIRELNNSTLGYQSLLQEAFSLLD